MKPHANPPLGYDARVQRFKRRLIVRALRITQGRVGEAAALLQLDRATMYRTFKSLGIRAKDYRANRKALARPVVKRAAPAKPIAPAATVAAPARRAYFGVDVGPDSREKDPEPVPATAFASYGVVE